MASAWLVKLAKQKREAGAFLTAGKPVFFFITSSALGSNSTNDVYIWPRNSNPRYLPYATIKQVHRDVHRRIFNRHRMFYLPCSQLVMIILKTTMNINPPSVLNFWICEACSQMSSYLIFKTTSWGKHYYVYPHLKTVKDKKGKLSIAWIKGHKVFSDVWNYAIKIENIMVEWEWWIFRPTPFS